MSENYFLVSAYQAPWIQCFQFTENRDRVLYTAFSYTREMREPNIGSVFTLFLEPEEALRRFNYDVSSGWHRFANSVSVGIPIPLRRGQRISRVGFALKETFVSLRNAFQGHTTWTKGWDSTERSMPADNDCDPLVTYQCFSGQ